MKEVTLLEGHPAIDGLLEAIDRDRQDLLERVVETNLHLKSYNVQFQRIFTTVGLKASKSFPGSRILHKSCTGSFYMVVTTQFF